MILQWTKNGLKKRQRFEEAANAEPSRCASYSGPADESIVVRPDYKSLPLNAGLSLPLQRRVGVADFGLEPLLVRCFDSFCPPSGPISPDVKTSWIWSTLTMKDHGRPLACALAAMSSARLGLVHNDHFLLQQARARYMLALSALQCALYDSALALQDRTLAAIRTLSFYEVCLTMPSIAALLTNVVPLANKR